MAIRNKNISATKKVANLKDTIKRLLDRNKKFSPEMIYQVELLASDLLLFRKIRDEAFDDETKLTIIEKSREGGRREKENPVFTLYVKYADRVRKDLRSLMMNQEIVKYDDEDKGKPNPLAEFMKNVNKEVGEEE